LASPSSIITTSWHHRHSKTWPWPWPMIFEGIFANSISLVSNRRRFRLYCNTEEFDSYLFNSIQFASRAVLKTLGTLRDTSWLICIILAGVQQIFERRSDIKYDKSLYLLNSQQKQLPPWKMATWLIWTERMDGWKQTERLGH
jgi:hypothetical protein